MSAETTIKELAQEAADWFVSDKRDNGDSFIKTKDDRPDWLTELIHDAHGDMFPDDYRYRFIASALDQLAEYGDSENAIDEIEPDIYTGQLTAWLASSCDRVYYLTTVLEEYVPDIDGFQLLAWAQLEERREVAYSVLESLRALAEARATDDDSE
jgi:hypothetical protein